MIQGSPHTRPVADAVNRFPLEKIRLFSLDTVQMRTFHISWLMFFVCFFGWFGLAPLMPAIRADLGLTKAQIGNTMIASVSSTIIARLLIGGLCDRFGPRKVAIWLLIGGSLPVFGVGLSRNYTEFLLFRLAIGIIGSSFVITQLHTAVMFSPKIRGTANALTAGWGNLGGGVTNILMPLIFAAIVGAGYTPHLAWRYAMLVPGILMWIIAFLYYRFTKDTPAGNFSAIRRFSATHRGIPAVKATRWSVLADWRVGALVLAYAMCFGMEISFDNVAALHFVDTFGLTQKDAGLWAGVFGCMNLFARALGGMASDKAGINWGMRGKGFLLSGLLLLQGVGLIAFANAGSFWPAVLCMIFFALFLKMANGATYGIVPFINEENIGLVSGVVGAGGNLGGMLFGFLFKSAAISYSQAFTYIGITTLLVSVIVLIAPWKNPVPFMKRFVPLKG